MQTLIDGKMTKPPKPAERVKTQTVVLEDQMGNEIHSFEVRADRDPRRVYWLPNNRCFLRDKGNRYKECSGGPAPLPELRRM